MTSSKPPKYGARWTAAEDDILRWEWGVRSAKRIAEKLGRSEKAVISRGVKVLKLGPPNRGYLSMNELERRSGFKRSTIILVARKHGIHLRRQPTYQRTTRPGSKDPRSARNYAITHETADRLIALLVERPAGKHRRETKGAWGEGTKPPACLDCATTTEPHCARGLCKACYMRRRAKVKGRKGFQGRPRINPKNRGRG